ncbi:UNVERIFIED_CONTAM: Zinc finger CCCH domain-containing protein 53 [Sesamum radiatum]|uniref:Zinc finger CCCH domain-containing protein 53 n=1 Tax=Sesamum radiatum TaxID=300843 RepID=A0AAW2S8B1_SESRA
MDAYEATKIVFQRIQTLDPQNASKIMGVLLIQDHGEKEMIRLAFGPESLVHSNSCSSSSAASSRLLGGASLPSPLSIAANQSCSWTNSSSFSSSDFQSPDDLISPSGYNGSSPSTMNSAAAPFYASGEVDLIDELQLQDQLSFLNDSSPPLGPKSSDFFYQQQQDLASSPTGNDPLIFPSYPTAAWGGSAAVNGLSHRRSCSVSDICMGSDDLSGGFGWKPCLFYARGYCKNGTSCRFLHGEGGASPTVELWWGLQVI